MNGVIESRFLGQLRRTPSLDEHAVFAGETEFASGMLPVQILIQHPDKFEPRYIELVDVAIEAMSQWDAMARPAIAQLINDQSSQPHQVLEHYRSDINVLWDGTDEEFVDGLRLQAVEFHPDGGLADIDRIILTYALRPGPLEPTIVVRLKQSMGPFVDSPPKA